MLTLPLNEIDKQEALRYMGCPGAPDASLLAVVSDCEEKLRRAVLPGVVYRVLPLCRENGVLSAGGMVLAGEDIARHLAECDRIILMAATLSGQADQLIHRGTGHLRYDTLPRHGCPGKRRHRSGKRSANAGRRNAFRNSCRNRTKPCGLRDLAAVSRPPVAIGDLPGDWALQPDR